ncbi:MAG: TIR domain-containing protein, partial [Candidatus Hermodarchaeota archaeon]
MSDNNQTRTCPACGLPVDEETMKSATGHLLCLKCTLQGTQEPDFKEIVYSMALGYFMAEKALTDPIEALSRAREFVSQLPYWQDTAFSTPSMESLIGLVSNMNQLQYTEELLEPRDFFISHKHAKELDNKLVEPLVIVLKEYDYRVWYDKDTWGTEAGKVEEWAKRGIDQARHCITVLCQPYFTSDACLYELNLMLTTKDPKHVFPIWWTDIDVPFLKQQEQGETLLNIVSINWNDWQGNINQLVDRVIQLANNAEGLKEYCGVALVANEAHILERLEFLISESISPLEPLSFENESLEMPDLGFNHENNHITALFLKNKGLKEIPAFLNQCKALHTLNLAQNPLIRTPKSLSTSLKKFIIRHYSQLTELEATILFM